MIGGLRCPFRLHQEDFAQALGIDASNKYENPGDQYAVKMFELIRKYSMNPLEDTLKLWKRIVFDFVLGNTDAHIKNFSLLYEPDLGGMRLSPAYDMISTAIYNASTREMSFNIGGKRELDKITEEDFRAMASQVGIGKNAAMNAYNSILRSFENAVLEASEELSAKGFKNAISIGERILEARKKLI